MHKNITIPLLCQCGLFILTCVSKNSIVSKDLTFYLLWYNAIRWSNHICKKSYFLSFYSFLVKFSEQHRESDRVKLKSVMKLNAVKNAIMQVTYFLNSHMFNWLFYWHIISYWEKLTFYKKFSHNLTLEIHHPPTHPASDKILIHLWNKIF